MPPHLPLIGYAVLETIQVEVDSDLAKLISDKKSSDAKDIDINAI